MAQIVEVFLAKLNVPLEEVDIFTSWIKERNMGELFAHFEGWDVQAIRKESREQALIEARIIAEKEAREKVYKEMQREIETTRKEVTQQVTESDIQKLLAVLDKLGCPRETAIEQLMEQYQLTQEAAAAKVDDFWERS